MRDIDKNASDDQADQIPMTEKQFIFVLTNMRRTLTPLIVEAAKRCIVEPGRESQKDVCAATGINPGQLSEAVRKIYVRRDELMAEKKLVCVEAWVPAEFEAGIRQTEAYFIDPLIGDKISIKKKTPAKKATTPKTKKNKTNS